MNNLMNNLEGELEALLKMLQYSEVIDIVDAEALLLGANDYLMAQRDKNE